MNVVVPLLDDPLAASTEGVGCFGKLTPAGRRALALRSMRNVS